MKRQYFHIKQAIQVSAFCFVTFCLVAIRSAARAQKINNIVIVHGAFADASGFEHVYKIPTKKGYHVSLVQNPRSSLEDDVAATNHVLEKQDGPVILVGHSWGGTVITQAGISEKVAGLVYIEGFMLESGATSNKSRFQSPGQLEFT